MKAFSCGDVVPGCDKRWVRSSDEELLREVASHAREAHGLISIPDELLASVRAAIVTV